MLERMYGRGTGDSNTFSYEERVISITENRFCAILDIMKKHNIQKDEDKENQLRLRLCDQKTLTKTEISVFNQS